MSSNDPEQIRQEIERTRAHLSDDVNALTDEANPKNVASRQVDKAKEGVRGLKDKIMGSDDDGPSRVDEARAVAGDRADDVRQRASDVRDAAGERVDDARQAIAGAPDQARQRTRGNPLAAGLIAFGIGALVGGLLPVSDAERRGAVALKEKAEPLKQEATSVAKEMADNIKEPAQQAAQEVKQTAGDAADQVKSEAQQGKEDVQQQAQSSTSRVQDSRG